MYTRYLLIVYNTLSVNVMYIVGCDPTSQIHFTKIKIKFILLKLLLLFIEVLQ